MKKFLINFAASSIAYFIAGFIGVSTFIGLIWLGRYSGIDMPYWVATLVFYGSFVLTTGISVILFFFVGSKLNLLGKHWLNYLSVSGSLIIPVILSVVLLDMSVLLLSNIPFFMLLEFTRTGGSEVHSPVFMCIIATFPSIITWLGMLYKSRKI